MDFGLDRMRNALDALGLLTPPFVTVQIVGTNGKGSTASMLSSVLTARSALRTVHLPAFAAVQRAVSNRRRTDFR